MESGQCYFTGEGNIYTPKMGIEKLALTNMAARIRTLLVVSAGTLSNDPSPSQLLCTPADIVRNSSKKKKICVYTTRNIITIIILVGVCNVNTARRTRTKRVFRIIARVDADGIE